MNAAVIVVGAAGGAVLLVVLVDILVTVFNYDGFDFVTRRLHLVTWRGLRLCGGVLPSRARHAFLSLGAAAMLPLTLVWWLTLEISAFAMMYLPGMTDGAFTLRQVRPEIGSAYYLSAGAISSLSFGDVVPRTGLYHALVDIETIIGLATFTLALSYVLAALDALTSLNRLYGRVRRHAVEPNRPATILDRYFHGGRPEELSSLLQSLADDLDAYDQGLRRYPVVFYFHTRRVDRSTPKVFAGLGELIELLCWGLPGDRSLREHPALLALAAEYTTTVRRLQRSFVGPDELQPPEPVGEHEFAHAGESADDYVTTFQRLQVRAAEASGESSRDVHRDYDSYRSWLPFHHRRVVFLDHLTTALGYGGDAPSAPRLATEDPR